MIIGESDELVHIVHQELSDPVSSHYSGTVIDLSQSEWIHTSSIPADQQTSIAEDLMLDP